MAEIYQEYFQEQYDENKHLRTVQVTYPQTFNFAYDVMDRYAICCPTQTALVHKDCAGKVTRFTFAQIRTLSNQAANVFRQNGIRKGDAVMLLLKRRYEFWICILALHKLGAVAIPTSHMVSAEDIASRVAVAKAKAVVCVSDDQICENVQTALSKKQDRTVLSFVVGGNREGFLDFAQQLTKAPATWERVETSVGADMLYYFTSGTSGDPKAVIHDFSYPIAHIYTAKYWHGMQKGGLHLTVADSGWAKSAWGKLYGQWFLGAAVMVYDYEQFYAKDLLKLLAEEQVHTFCAPPTIYKYLVRENLTRYDLSHLEQVTTAGESLPKEVAKKFFEMTGKKIREGFGQTETALLICTPTGEEPIAGSIGRPSPLYRIELVDEDNQPVAVGEEGELVIVPTQSAGGKRDIPLGIFKGYLGDETRYEEVWQGGIYHTRDKAYRDQAGNYFFVGRNDDVIKSSGYRIGPSEVEDVLMQHPAVLECAVTGYPSKTRGAIVKASIILQKGYLAEGTLKNEIQDFVKQRTALYKYPRMIQFVTDLPRTSNGKISRSKIRAMDYSVHTRADRSES